ncbi:MAG: SufD family Fe-S cluster assembly protein [Victivallales bacterium]|nr:SufD family Fe-S cluster assembly protein [Victivallales bacterium]
MMNEKTGQTFSIAADNAPVPGCTISKLVKETRGQRISHFALAAGTDISPETYPAHKLWIVVKIAGNAPSHGHTDCDSIIMDCGRIIAVPALEANDVDSALVHEAAIGKIAGDQLVKLMTLGLTEQEAEEQIISGFLK